MKQIIEREHSIILVEGGEIFFDKPDPDLFKEKHTHIEKKKLLTSASDECREALRTDIIQELDKTLESDIRRAKEELLLERNKFINQITEELKNIIRDMIREEKENIWATTKDFKFTPLDFRSQADNSQSNSTQG